MNVDRLLLVSKLKKKLNLSKIHRKFYFNIKTKSSLSTWDFIFFAIFEILWTKLYLFWTQTCRNWSELFTWTCYFLKYHMPLRPRDHISNVISLPHRIVEFSWFYQGNSLVNQWNILVNSEICWSTSEFP